MNVVLEFVSKEHDIFLSNMSFLYPESINYCFHARGALMLGCILYTTPPSNVLPWNPGRLGYQSVCS